jgi:type I restriction enzyme S subunit
MDRGHLPEGWKIKKIREIGKVQTGSTPKTSDKNNFGDDISFIKPPDFLKDGSLNYSSQGLSKLGTKEARIIDKDSVLMVCIGATIGKVGFTEKEVTANQQINSLTPLNGDHPKFIFYQMLTKNFQQKVLDSSGQATLPIINKTKWSELESSTSLDNTTELELIRTSEIYKHIQTSYLSNLTVDNLPDLQKANSSTEDKKEEKVPKRVRTAFQTTPPQTLCRRDVEINVGFD